MDAIELLQSREEINPKIVQRSRIEGAVIRKLAAEDGLTSYVDLGCWVGLLARDVLSSGGFGRAVLVDAVPSCLRMTAAKLPPMAQVEFHLIAVVPGAEQRTFCIPGHDTSCAGFGQGGVSIAVKHREVCEFLRSLQLDLDRTYLKVDLEGLDLRIVERLAQEKLLPGVLHIEVSSQADYDGLHAALGGHYVIPPLKPGHAFFSMALGKSRSVLIGFDPDVAYS